VTKKKAIVIGAGVGGITTASLLARKGYSVNLYEKNAFPGGRCGALVKDGHRFDLGATLLMMPDTYKSIFASIGKDLHQELDLIRMEPIYKIKFHGGKELVFTCDMARMKEQLESIEPGSFTRFLSFMDESYTTLKLSMAKIIERNYYNALEFFNIKNVLLFAKIKAFNNHYRYTAKFFKSDILKAAFTLQNIYVGQNPFRAPAVFEILPFQELTEGVFFPKGGMSQIVNSLVKAAEENGVSIQYNSPVKRMDANKKAIRGVILENGEFVPADLVICNADVPYVYRELLPEGNQGKRINRMKFACSAIVFHWGLDKKYDNLEQHTVFVSKDYREGINEIFGQGRMLTDPSFYVHSPVQKDPSAAPEGQDSMTVIVPAAHLDKEERMDTESMRDQVRKIVLDRFASEGISDLKEHIKFEICFTQHNWKKILNVTHGAMFGSLDHNIFQMGYMRPHNRHNKYRNLFFVGGSTHPGNGVPMSLISAKLTSEKVLHYYGSHENWK